LVNCIEELGHKLMLTDTVPWWSEVHEEDYDLIQEDLDVAIH
jgi:hypothetical protein